MCEDLYYSMTKSKLGLAVIINNLDKEQEPTKKDVEVMGKVLKDIGKIIDFDGRMSPISYLSRI